MSVNKYDTNPARLKSQKDIVEYIVSLGERLASKEVSLQAGHTAIEDGDFVVRNGDIIVSETEGDVVLRILHGVQPEIRMFPLGEGDTHRVTLYAYDDVSAGQGTTYTVEKDDGTQDGGQVILTKSDALYGYFPATGNRLFFWLNGGGLPGVTLYYGKWTNQQQGTGEQGLYMGTFVATSGFSTWTHTYFTPFDSAIIPICTVMHSGSTIEWVLDSFSTSQFTVRFSSTANNKTINFWNFRVT